MSINKIKHPKEKNKNKNKNECKNKKEAYTLKEVKRMLRNDYHTKIEILRYKILNSCGDSEAFFKVSWDNKQYSALFHKR